MITTRFRGVDNFYRSSIRIENDLKRKGDELVNDVADVLINEIRSNWSFSAPSSPGNPPAVVTGNLDSSITKDSQGRDPLGRFATRDNVSMVFVRVDTENGSDPQGRGNYAQVLEFDMNRAFLEPAIQRVEKLFPELVRRRLR